MRPNQRYASSATWNSEEKRAELSEAIEMDTFFLSAFALGLGEGGFARLYFVS